MKVKRGLAILLALSMVLTGAIPALSTTHVTEPLLDSAVEQDSGEMQKRPSAPRTLEEEDALFSLAPMASEKMPAFSARLVEENGETRLEGTLEFLPADAVSIKPMYYDEDLDYDFFISDSETQEEREWLVPTVDSGQQAFLTQLCAGALDEPFCYYLNQEISRFSVFLEIITQSGQRYETERVLISQNKPTPMPSEPPAFSAYLQCDPDGYKIYGHFTAFTEDILQVIPTYSVDGKTYVSTSNGWRLKSGDVPDITDQICLYDSQGPMPRYISGEIDSFFVRLQIKREDGQSYQTQAFEIVRPGEQPQPKDTRPFSIYSPNMAVRDARGTPYYGSVQVVAREGTTAKELLALLPTHLPVDVNIMTSQWEIVASGRVRYPVEWVLPEDVFPLTLAQSPVVISSAAKEPVIEAGYRIKTPMGSYLLNQAAVFDAQMGKASGRIRLTVQVIPKEAEPELGLQGIADAEQEAGYPLALSFLQKPSGATALNTYYYVEGDEEWTEIFDLLDQKEVDYQPKNLAYGSIVLLTEGDAPYRDFLAGKNNGFVIGVEVIGGVYDKAKVLLPWPAEYTMPPNLPENFGSGGNKGDVGSDNSGDSVGNGGQRPGMDGDGQGPSAGNGVGGGNDGDDGGANDEIKNSINAKVPNASLPVIVTPVTPPDRAPGIPSMPLPRLPTIPLPLVPQEPAAEGEAEEQEEQLTEESAVPTSVTGTEDIQRLPPALGETAGGDGAVSVWIMATLVVLGGGAALVAGLGLTGKAGGLGRFTKWFEAVRLGKKR